MRIRGNDTNGHAGSIESIRFAAVYNVFDVCPCHMSAQIIGQHHIIAKKIVSNFCRQKGENMANVGQNALIQPMNTSHLPRSSLPWIILVPLYDMQVVVKARANRKNIKFFANTPKTLFRERRHNRNSTNTIETSDLGTSTNEPGQMYHNANKNKKIAK